MALTGYCPSCGGTGRDGEDRYCPSCGARIRVGREGTEIHVVGSNADEVAQVARQLTEDVSARREARGPRTPWASGAFYLVCVMVVIALLLVVGRVLAAWTLPVVIIGAVVIVATVGALQLRQDDRLSERGFLSLMQDTLRHLPRLAGRGNGQRQQAGEVDASLDATPD